MHTELAAARSDLAVVKDDLMFAKRAVKTFESSKSSSKEALWVFLLLLFPLLFLQFHHCNAQPSCDIFTLSDT